MRALLSTFLILVFAGGPAFAGICASACVHENDRSKAHQQEDHSCCDSVKEESKKEQSHDCTLSDCMVSMPSVEVPLLTSEIETKKKLIDPDLASEIAAQFRLANLSSKALSLERSDPDVLTPKVPLYIFFQKLLIPHHS